MSIECLQASANSRSLTTKIFDRNLRRSKPELYRLSTYRTWRTNTHSHQSPAVLSKAGFSYTGKGDRVKCETCQLEIEQWTTLMNPMEEHLRQQPSCPYVVSRKEIFVNKGTSIVSLTEKTTDQSQNEVNVTVSELQGVRTETLFIDILSHETVDRARKYTFLNWPTITPSATQMASAGWWYTNIADRVICIHCDVMFHNWTEHDNPYDVHRLKSPKCYFVQMDEVHHKDQPRELPVANTNLSGISSVQAIAGAAHADYALVSRRRATFEKITESKRSALPPVDSFVDAGFFYAGEDTIVRCFYCNGALRRWQPNDEPKIEHARWFPHCAYIRQFIGENLYQAIQRKNRELRAQQSLQEASGVKTGVTNATKYTPWTNEEIERMVKARLDLPIVEKLRQENISMAIIRKVFDMQLRFKKDDFRSDLDLRIACVILEKQVKLINGNESNILIPRNWIKAYIEKQSNENEKECPILETKQIEVAQTSDRNSARPRVSSKQTDDSMLCVLCLATERQVACLPCGHLTSCVACGHSLKTCPLCRTPVKAYVRVYI